MKYQIIGYSNGQIYLLEIDSKYINKATLWPVPTGPDGSVVDMITPEAAKIEKEKEVDLTLSGVISKNKEEE